MSSVPALWRTKKFAQKYPAKFYSDDGEEEPEIEVDAEEATPRRQDTLKMLHSLRLLCSTVGEKDQVLEKIDYIELSVKHGKCTKQRQLTDFFQK